jgi:hypothetical protein
MRITTPRGRLRSMGNAAEPTRIVRDGLEIAVWREGVLTLTLPGGARRREETTLENAVRLAAQAWAGHGPDRR